MPSLSSHLNPEDPTSYEGLVSKTAMRFGEMARVRGFEEDDFKQVLRIKVWQAINAYDPSRTRMQLPNFVFGCMTNLIKDIKGKRVRSDAYLEDLLGPGGSDEGVSRGDNSRNAMLLSVDQETAFRELETEVLLPESLDEDERAVALLLIEDYAQHEIATTLGIRRTQVRAHIAAIRLKMGVGKRHVAPFDHLPEGPSDNAPLALAS